MNNFLGNFDELSNATIFLKICVIFSLPHSNEMTEIMFNLVGLAWRKERNILDIQTLEVKNIILENLTKNLLNL